MSRPAQAKYAEYGHEVRRARQSTAKAYRRSSQLPEAPPVDTSHRENIGSSCIWRGPKDLFSSCCIDPAIFQFAWRSTASRVYTNRWKSRLRAGLFPFSQRRGPALKFLILHKKRSIRLGFASESLILRIDKALHLFFTRGP